MALMVAAAVLDALDVVDHVYASIEDLSRLPIALEQLAKLLDARAAGVRIETTELGVEQTWFGIEPSFHDAYVEHYWQHDPWAIRIWEAGVGDFGHGDAVCPRAIVEASEFHNELASKAGFDDLAGGVLERTAARVVSIGIMKGKSSKRFDEDTDRLARRIVPHFARALSLRARLLATSPSPSPSPSPSALTPSATAASLTQKPGLLQPQLRAHLHDRVLEHLRAQHHLTGTEARVAIAIGSGLSPKEVALQLGTSWHTVRSHLRQIFAKTEQRSQSSLARLVTLVEADLDRQSALSSR